jgi:hypothetical protein
MLALVNRLFCLEEINGHGACPTYLYRWTLLRLGPFAALPDGTTEIDTLWRKV